MGPRSSDDDAFLGSSPQQELGLIELKILPIQTRPQNAPPTPISLSDIKVHERSKKAVTQKITLAEPVIMAKPKPLLEGRRTGPDIVKFFFKYRPIDILRANGIAPPPPQLKRKASAEPPPPRAQTPDDSEALADLEEAKVLREKLRALEAKLSKRDQKKTSHQGRGRGCHRLDAGKLAE